MEGEYTFNKYKILEDRSVVIVEVTSREYELDGVLQQAPLRVNAWRWIQVLVDGTMTDTGNVDPDRWKGPVFSVSEIEDWAN